MLNRNNTVISPNVIEDYMDLALETTADLNALLNDVEEKMNRLEAANIAAITGVVDCQAILEENESVRKGLDECAQLSALIAQFEKASTEHIQFSGRPSAYKYTKTGLSEFERSIQSLKTQLQSHGAITSSGLEAMYLDEPLNQAIAAQLARLQHTRESLAQCICFVSGSNKLAIERRNIVQDLNLMDNSNEFITENGPTTIRWLSNIRGYSVIISGQVIHDSLQTCLEDLILDTAEGQEDAQRVEKFSNRFGTGVVILAETLD